MTLWKSLAQRDVLMETAERIRQLSETEATLVGLSALRQWLSDLTKYAPTPSNGHRQEFGEIQAEALELLTHLSSSKHPAASSRAAFSELDNRLKHLGV